MSNIQVKKYPTHNLYHRNLDNTHIMMVHTKVHLVRFITEKAHIYQPIVEGENVTHLPTQCVVSSTNQ